MTTNWKGKTAIITGGGGGLGLAVAKKLYQVGTTVVLLDNRLERLQEAKEHFDSDVLVFEVDVTNFSAVKKVVDEIVLKTQTIDILINCAGIVGQTKIKTHEIELDDFDRVMAVNVRGSLVPFKAVAPYMLQNNYGRVLNVASISGKEGNAGMTSYSTSKAAVIGMTKAQGKEYALTNITINAIAPAVIYTEMVEGLPPEQIKYMTDKIPMQRCGTMEEFADMAKFIVSEENRFCTGFTFDLTGGRAVY